MHGRLDREDDENRHARLRPAAEAAEGPRVFPVIIIMMPVIIMGAITMMLETPGVGGTPRRSSSSAGSAVTPAPLRQPHAVATMVNRISVIDPIIEF